MTDATGGAPTVIDAEPTTLSIVTCTVAVPGDTPVTTPLCDTVATLAAPLAHVAGRPLMTFPLASFAVAASATVAPTTIEALDGAIVTDATCGALTVTC